MNQHGFHCWSRRQASPETSFQQVAGGCAINSCRTLGFDAFRRFSGLFFWARLNRLIPAKLPWTDQRDPRQDGCRRELARTESIAGRQEGAHPCVNRAALVAPRHHCGGRLGRICSKSRMSPKSLSRFDACLFWISKSRLMKLTSNPPSAPVTRCAPLRQNPPH